MMKLGRLVHEEHCVDDDCRHDCMLEEQTTLQVCNPSATAFKELFELCSFHAKNQDDEAMEKQSGKTTSKKVQRRSRDLFLPHNASKLGHPLCYIPGLVRYYHLM